MAVFSTNQVRHLYVVNTAETEGTHVTPAKEVGHATLQFDTAKKHLYLEYRGVDSVMRSDLISIEDILYAKSNKADNMQTKLKSYTIALDKAINSGNPVSGQDYILRLAFRQYLGMSDEDQYFKYGMVHAYAGMTPDKFYKILAQSLAKNFSREVCPLVKIEVHSTATKSKGKFDAQGYMVVSPDTKDTGVEAESNPYYADNKVVVDIDSVRITEVEQPWVLGTMPRTSVYYTVQTVPVTVEGDEVHWATITEGTNGTLHNGKTIADMEYFYMGERGDQYRNVGWPNVIPTKYLVDATKPYDTFDIHYAYVGSNESVQKSEKTLTIVCPHDSMAELNKLITRFNTATGTKFNVATIS